MSNSKTKTYLSFYMGTELFGSDVKYILEVLKDEPLTKVPRTEDFIEGIINFRGEIVTVIDFYKKLNMPGTDSLKKDVVIILELFSNEKSIKVGIITDKVRKVFELSDSEVKPVPEFGKYYNPEFLTGVVKTSDGLVMLLDIEKVITASEVDILRKINNDKS